MLFLNNIAMKLISIKILLIVFVTLNLYAQKNDSIVVSSIYKNALNDYTAYDNLKLLCDSASPRPFGSDESIKAVYLFAEMLENAGVEQVELQAYQKDIWKNISSSATLILPNSNIIDLNVVAIGPSVATSENGITADIIQVDDLEALEKLPNEDVEGKIVFFNSPMKNSFINPINAYVDAVGPRFFGAVKAAEKGAVAIIVRSVTMEMDSIPRSGCLRYANEIAKIPAVIVSPEDAIVISKQIEKENNLQANVNVNSVILENETTYNVVAEIKGKTKPDEVILVGAHIDTWFNTPGAHDDGAGCVQMIDVLRIFKTLSLNNNRTIRCVLFMDEEMYQSGAQAYTDSFDDKKETIVAAIESDLGAYQPDGFFIDAVGEDLAFIQGFKTQLEPYGLDKFEKGFGGGDMSVIKRKYDFISMALRVENQRYWNIMHTENDTFDKINRRELQFGTAAITGLVYLIDSNLY